MNEKEIFVMEQEIEKGHVAKAVLIFLESFLREQRSKIINMLENGTDSKTDIFIADLRALSRFEKSLRHCVELGEKAEQKIKN